MRVLRLASKFRPQPSTLAKSSFLQKIVEVVELFVERIAIEAIALRTIVADLNLGL
jgi:hypothetical protein